MTARTPDLLAVLPWLRDELASRVDADPVAVQAARGYRSGTQLKCERMDTPRNLQAGAFAGTAEAYLRYRPPYPKALVNGQQSFRGSGHLKFPRSAAMDLVPVISRRIDRDAPLAVGRVVLERAAG
jgi:hypothetical protein